MQMKSLTTSMLGCTLLMSALFHTQPAHAQNQAVPPPADLPKDMKAVYADTDRATQDLKAHGVEVDEQSLINFLENGLAKMEALPARPLEKSQLLIDAMAKLSNMRSAAAVPIISRIARFDNTVKSFKIVEYDVSKTTSQSREDFRQRAYRLVQFNAVNALSLIGNPESADIVRNVLAQERTAGAQIQYAICLASLGDTSGVDYLVALINMRNRKESAAAAKAFFFITGEDFGYTEDSPVRARAALAPRYSEWWQHYRQTFRVNPEAVRERRLNANAPKVAAARSTRDLLKLAANYFDFNNTLGSADARKTLNAAGSSLNAEFKKVALNQMEDLDVRMEALNWYFEANRRSANTDPMEIYKPLRKDENPEIADKVATLLSQLTEDKALQQIGNK